MRASRERHASVTDHFWSDVLRVTRALREVNPQYDVNMWWFIRESPYIHAVIQQVCVWRVFRQASFPSIKSKKNRKQAPRYGFVNCTGPGKTTDAFTTLSIISIEMLIGCVLLGGDNHDPEYW